MTDDETYELCDRLSQLEAQNAELKASCEMAAEHMARDQEYIGRLEAELDGLKASVMDLQKQVQQPRFYGSVEKQPLYFEKGPNP